MTESRDISRRPEGKGDQRQPLRAIPSEPQPLRGIGDSQPEAEMFQIPVVPGYNVDPGRMRITSFVDGFDQRAVNAGSRVRDGITNSAKAVVTDFTTGIDKVAADHNDGVDILKENVRNGPENVVRLGEKLDEWGEEHIFVQADKWRANHPVKEYKQGAAIIGTVGVGGALIFNHFLGSVGSNDDGKSGPIPDLSSEAVAVAPPVAGDAQSLRDFTEPRGSLSREHTYETGAGEKLIAVIATPPFSDGDVSVSIDGDTHEGGWQGQLGNEQVQIPVNGCDVFVSRDEAGKPQLQTDC